MSVRVALFFVAVFSPTSAWAAIYQVDTCVDYRVGFSDSGIGSNDDFMTTNADVRAYGGEVKIQRNSDSAVLFNNYTNPYGVGTPGCTGSIALDSTQTYTVTVSSKALPNGSSGNKVWEHELAGGVWTDVKLVVSTTYSPTFSGTKVWKTDTNPRWGILAAGSWAQIRADGGVTGKEYVYRYPDSGGTRWDRVNEKIGIGTGGDDNRYAIVHETGHALGHFRNGNQSPDHDYGAPTNQCVTGTDDHDMTSKEFQSSAAWEGWAHLYAAVAFNDWVTDDDCTFVYWKNSDWDQSGTAEKTAAYQLDCQNTPLSGTIDNNDFLGDRCGGGGISLSNRGNEYDWLRFWWDELTLEGLTFYDVADIWDAANPHTWRPTDSGGAAFPATRLHDAAVGLALETEDENRDVLNGVQR